ncbi:MAG TPA: 50S ribosomal protein L6 [Acholeplasmataceae bacterium]|jgi:large subunit ribosomal protein L6|nr:50S ribosomal protein L6 [Acholeplasmataceae bacterium]
MSRIGNKVIKIPAGVEVMLQENNEVVVKGPKGELKSQFNPIIDIKIENGEIKLSRPNNERFTRQIHGTTRALLANMVHGVHEEFKKKLIILGVGYRAQVNGNTLALTMGFSHPVDLEIPEGLAVTVEKNTEVTISGISKELVGEFAANVRKVRKPEPYKGKGIRYENEHVRRKAGKTAK